MVVGIDIGSTTTKAVALREGRILCKIKTRALDAVTSATGVLGKLTIENGFEIADIDHIVMTGVGASKIQGNIFSIPTSVSEEVKAIGHGGQFLSGEKDIVIANIGTGTIIIEAKGERIVHLGGTGVGGGTIVGLSKVLLNTLEFKNIMDMASRGRLNQVDLTIRDINESNISFLGKDTTAANFGKMLDTATSEDKAIGIINLVYQVIGMLSVFAAQSRKKNCVIVTGNGSNNELGKRVLAEITKMYGIRFEFPEDAEYATAIGAALAAGV